MKFISSNYVLQRRILQRFVVGQLKFNFKSWSIVFFGSDEFSLGSLRVLHKLMKDKLIGSVELVTKNNNCPVFEYAELHSIKIHFWPPVLNNSYDFGVLVSFGKIIPKRIIDLFPYGIINVHPSLLPRWRGGMPISHSIINGDTITGVTVIRINSAVDAGDIILQRPVPIGEHEMLPSLYNKLNKIGAECLSEVIQNMPECLDNVKPQSKKNVTKAPILEKSAMIVQWNSMTSKEIYNLYRGVFQKFPLASTFKGENIYFVCISLTQAILPESGEEKIPGMFVYNKKIHRLIVLTVDNSIEICTVRFQGKMQTAHNFYNGYLNVLLKKEWRFGT